MRHRIIFLLSILILSLTNTHARAQAQLPEKGVCIFATDYAKADGVTDVTADLQRMIDENPNRTLYFPDGTYLISESLRTPADPKKSVHLVLANYATIKAASDWKGDALIRLGGKDAFNTIYVNGSNYGIEGGILDGSSLANGISIDSGRESRISHVSIKNTQIGIHIRYGANNGSSDADVVDVNIVGNKDKNSIGVLLEGYDNSLTNMRIASINTGVWCKSGGNSLKNIHPLTGMDYERSCAFRVEGSNNWFDYCYSDQFSRAFYLAKGVYCHFTFCWAWWYNGNVPFQTAIECDGPMESIFYGLRTGFKGEDAAKCLIKAEDGGKGYIHGSIIPATKWASEDKSPVYLKHY